MNTTRVLLFSKTSGEGRLLRNLPASEARRLLSTGQAAQLGRGNLRAIGLTGHGNSNPNPMSHVEEDSPLMFTMVLKTADSTLRR